MMAKQKFLEQPQHFWANVRAISETAGYTVRNKGDIKIPTLEEVRAALLSRKLRDDHIVKGRKLTALGELLFEYFYYRADVLNNYARPLLMDAGRAKAVYNELKKKFKPSRRCPLPMNKQKGKKRAEAYLTCIVNMIIEANSKGFDCDYDPRALTTVILDGAPLRTLARRVDGAFPSTVNPVAPWEIRDIIIRQLSAAESPTAFTKPCLTAWSFMS